MTDRNEMNEKNELKDEELEEISGGAQGSLYLCHCPTCNLVTLSTEGALCRNCKASGVESHMVSC